MSFSPRSNTGVSAFTTTSSSFTMPAVASTVSVSVATTAWMAVGQRLFVTTAGYMTVSSITNTTTVVLTNNGDTGNAASTTVIASGKTVTPSSLIGPTGATGPNAPQFSFVNWVADVSINSGGLVNETGQNITSGMRFFAIGAPVCTGVRFCAIATATYRCKIYKRSDSSVVATVDHVFTTVKGIGVAKFASSVTLVNGVEYFATVWDTGANNLTVSTNNVFNTFVTGGTPGFIVAEQNIQIVNTRSFSSGDACPLNTGGDGSYPVEPYFGA